MRYENWDVIIFPDGSKVPIQEFKTQCFVTKDAPGSAYLQTHPYIHPSAFHMPTPLSHASLGQTPCLTTFIPSLEPGSAFRCSVHNWTKPRPSRMMEGLMRPEDTVLFEVRVFIDGVCVSASLINETMWPHVVELSSFVDKLGDQERLTFPIFHEELLHQTYWDAGETYGRIRVVLSEGFARPHRQPPFERVKDIVIFSFQHAPLHVLESSGIAWPNPGMWQLAQRQTFRYNFTPDIYAGREEPDGHVHSPTRREQRIDLNIPSVAVGDRALPPWMWPRSTYPGNWNEKEPVWTQPPPPQPSFQAADPFLDAASREAAVAAATKAAADVAAGTVINANFNTGAPLTARRTENVSDVSMPDYTSFRGIRDSRDTSSGQTFSSMKSVMYHRKEASQASVKQPAATDDREYSNLIDAIQGRETRKQQQQQQQKLPKRSSRQRKSQQTRESSRSTAGGTIPAPAPAPTPASAPAPEPAVVSVAAPAPATAAVHAAPVVFPTAITVLPESTPTTITIASSMSKSPSSVLAVAGSAASRKASHVGALLELPGSKTNSRNPSAASSGLSLGGGSSAIGTDRDHPLVLDDGEGEDDEDDEEEVEDDGDDDGFESPLPPSKLLTPNGGSDYLRGKKEGRKAIQQRRKLTRSGSGGAGNRRASTSTYSASSASSSLLNTSLFRDSDLPSAKPRAAAVTASITDTPPPPSSSSSGSTGIFRTAATTTASASAATAAAGGGDNTKRKRSSQVSPLSQLGQTPNENNNNDTSGLVLGLGLGSDDSVIREASPNKKKVIRMVDPDGEDQENMGDGGLEMLIGAETGLAAVAVAAAATATATAAGGGGGGGGGGSGATGLGADGAADVAEVEDE